MFEYFIQLQCAMSSALNMFFIYLIPSVFSLNYVLSADGSLVKFLTSRGYDPSTRPEEKTTVVNISINTFTVFEMDQTQEMMEFSAEFMLSWFDPLMTWNRSVYNITWTKLKESYLWKPDITVSTSIKTRLLVDADERYGDVRFDGLVRISYYGVFINLCPMKVNNFPYDVQKCEVEIGPWSYTSAQVLSQPVPYIANWNESVKGNSEWDVLGMCADQFNDTDEDVDFNYTSVVWFVTVKRKPQFYIWVLLVPSFIITTIAIFGIFVPTNHKGEREEKVTLGLTTLLSTAVILEIVASTMPKASSLPLLGNFILAEIFITAAGVLCSVCVLILHHRAITHNWNVPRWLIVFSAFPCRVRTHLKQRKRRDNPPPYSEVKEYGRDTRITVERSLRNDSIISDLNELLIKVTDWIEQEERSRMRYLTWNRVFERIDFIFLIIFQIINIVIVCVMT